MNGPINVFVVYASSSKEDEELCAQLLKHLKPLEHDGSVITTHVEQVRPGDSWKATLAKYLAEAKAVLLLYSADFAANQLCMDLEQLAVERAKDGKTCVLPVLLRPCVLGERDIAGLVPLPSNRIPVTRWGNQDEAWTNVVEGIKDAIVNRRRGQTYAPMPRNDRADVLRKSGMNGPSPTWPAPAAIQAALPSSPPVYYPAPLPRVSVPAPQAAPLHRESRPPPTVRPRRWGRVGVAMIFGLLIAIGWFLFFSPVSPWAGLGPYALLPWNAAEAPAANDQPQPPHFFPTGVANPSNPSTLPTDKPKSQSPVQMQTPSSCPSACCGGEQCLANQENRSSLYSQCGSGNFCGSCRSGRNCVPGACSAKLEPERLWRLRLGGLALKNANSYAKRRTLCVRRHNKPERESHVCVDVIGSAKNEIDPQTALRNRLSLQTKDLLSGAGLDVWLFDDNVQIAESIGLHVGENLKYTALCGGVVLKAPAPKNTAGPHLSEVNFFLDDP